MQKSEYVFIIPLDEKPEIPTPKKPKSLSTRIVEEFIRSGVAYAKVPMPKDQKKINSAVGLRIGLALASKKMKKNIKVRQHPETKEVFLLKE